MITIAGRKAKCVNNIYDPHYSSVVKGLTLGKVYKILEVYEDKFEIIDDSGFLGTYASKRFELLSEDSDGSKTKPSQKSDFDFFKSRVNSNECVCGIPKHACSYHR